MDLENHKYKEYCRKIVEFIGKSDGTKSDYEETLIKKMMKYLLLLKDKDLPIEDFKIFTENIENLIDEFVEKLFF